MTTYNSTEKSELKDAFHEASAEYKERIENLSNAQTPEDRFDALTDEQQESLEIVRAKAMYNYEIQNPNATPKELLAAGNKEIQDLLNFNDPRALDRAVSENIKFVEALNDKYEKLNQNEQVDGIADKMFEKYKNDRSLSSDDKEILETFCRYKALSYAETTEYSHSNQADMTKRDEVARINFLNSIRGR